MANRQTTAKRPAHQPMAWERMASALEMLEQSDVLQAQAIDAFKEQLQQLQQQAAEHWYEHSTLEAGDTLRRHLEHALETLAGDLRQIGAVLSELGEEPSRAGTPAWQHLREPFGQALDGLELGRLPLQEQLLGQLETLDRNHLTGLSQDEVTRLKEQLRSGAAIVREAQRRSRLGQHHADRQWGDKRNGGDKRFAPCPFGEGDGDCSTFSDSGREGQSVEAGEPSAPGSMPGQGGITRGPGTAPLQLEPRPSFEFLKRLQVVQGADAPKDDDQPNIFYSREAPQVDRSQAHTRTLGGDAQVQGDGGATVWKHRFAPAERDVLERFFK